MSVIIEERLAKLFIQKVQNHLCEGICKDIDEENRERNPTDSRECASHQVIQANSLFMEALNDLNITGTGYWEKSWLMAAKIGFAHDYNQEHSQYTVAVTVHVPVYNVANSDEAKATAFSSIQKQLPDTMVVVKDPELIASNDDDQREKATADSEKLAAAMALFRQKLPKMRNSQV